MPDGPMPPSSSAGPPSRPSPRPTPDRRRARAPRHPPTTRARGRGRRRSADPPRDRRPPRLRGQGPARRGGRPWGRGLREPGPSLPARLDGPPAPPSGPRLRLPRVRDEVLHRGPPRAPCAPGDAGDPPRSRTWRCSAPSTIAWSTRRAGVCPGSTGRSSWRRPDGTPYRAGPHPRRKTAPETGRSRRASDRHGASEAHGGGPDMAPRPRALGIRPSSTGRGGSRDTPRTAGSGRCRWRGRGR